jgi:NAD+ kinase
MRPTPRKPPRALTQVYGNASLRDADVIVALGGDGFLLQTMRETMSTGKRVYGMNRGTIGFLMNEYNERICRSASPTPCGNDPSARDDGRMR